MDKKNGLAKKIYSKATIEKIKSKVNLLGISSDYDPIFLLNVRLFLTVSIFFVILYFIDFGYLVAPFITFIFYIFFFPVLIDTKIKKRGIKLENEALYFFEVLSLSLEAGRGLKNALDITVYNVESELSLEFKKALEDVALGKSLNDSLNDLKNRIPSDIIGNIILNIRESNMFGNSITSTMRNQIEYIREKRILRAKAIISKTPVKISVISVVFFIPLLLLLLLGPMLITLLF